MHSMRHMNKIEDILDECGFPAQRFKNQSNLLSAMLEPGEDPLAGCIGHQYSPPPAYDFPMLILATNIRMISFVSNTDRDSSLPTRSLGHAYNQIEEIYCYRGEQSDGEVRIRYKGNRRVVIYNKIVTSPDPVMDAISQLNTDVRIYSVSQPMKEVFSWKERISNKVSRWHSKTRRFLASQTLTIILNILLAIAVIAQAVAFIMRN